MALCLATSLVECNGFDAADQMARYCRWRDQGYLSSNGRCFDIGATVASASGALPAHRRPHGRLHPIPTRPATAASCAWRRTPLYYFA
jgi:ADP-ribosylglycohydrolase